MNNRKGQNSIIFLTTLGVYLGLVLVGSTPQIAAQRAAMTRDFDISDEVEFKDDLDNKPDDDRSVTNETVESCLEGLEELLTALGSLNTDAQFKTDTLYVVRTDLLPSAFPAEFQLTRTLQHYAAARQKLNEATALHIDNDQVLVVSHLPRAAIDPLPAIDVN